MLQWAVAKENIQWDSSPKAKWFAHHQCCLETEWQLGLLGTEHPSLAIKWSCFVCLFVSVCQEDCAHRDRHRQTNKLCWHFPSPTVIHLPSAAAFFCSSPLPLPLSLSLSLSLVSCKLHPFVWLMPRSTQTAHHNHCYVCPRSDNSNCEPHAIIMSLGSF